MSCFESVAMQHDASDDVARSKVIDETYLYELIAASEFCIAASQPTWPTRATVNVFSFTQLLSYIVVRLAVYLIAPSTVCLHGTGGCASCRDGE
jgi:hypothetical protein